MYGWCYWDETKQGRLCGMVPHHMLTLWNEVHLTDLKQVLDAYWIICANENQLSFTVFWWVGLLNPLYNSQHYEHFPSWNNPLRRSFPFPLTFAVTKSRIWTPNFLSPEGKNSKNTSTYSMRFVVLYVCFIMF